MAKVYVFDAQGKSSELKRIRCRDEGRELQDALANNHDLLPGEQINPDNPCRWLLIKREMPVPDPTTGEDRWSLDFVFVDQEAMPTFVECKRFNDTRSRREVIGQMFEYAANGHHYWTADGLRENAEAVAKQAGLTLEDAIKNLTGDPEQTPELFFERVQNNLREAQLRIIFFLDEAPQELRSLVDFLNKQMERTEVLLVEARQYEDGGRRVIVPTLFGFTEQARLVKRTTSVTKSSSIASRKWDEASFFEEIQRTLSEPQYRAAIRGLYDECVSLGLKIVWGAGKHVGSFAASLSSISSKPLIHVFTMGNLNVNYGSIKGPEMGGVNPRFVELFKQIGMAANTNEYQYGGTLV